MPYLDTCLSVCACEIFYNLSMYTCNNYSMGFFKYFFNFIIHSLYIFLLLILTEVYVPKRWPICCFYFCDSIILAVTRGEEQIFTAMLEFEREIKSSIVGIFLMFEQTYNSMLLSMYRLI